MKKIIMLIICMVLAAILTGCGLPSKSWGTAGSADAFKFTITEGQTGSITPELVAGGGAHAMLFQKPYEGADTAYPTMVAYSRRKSMWGLFSGDVGSGNVSFLYIAGSRETPEQTAKILEGVAKIVNDPRILKIKDTNGEKPE